MADSLRDTHYIAISDGYIEITFAGMPRDADPVRFVTEEAAAQALAQAMHRTNVATLMRSSSVNWPDEDLRPSFDITRFDSRVRSALTENAPTVNVTRNEVTPDEGRQTLGALAAVHPDHFVLIERHVSGNPLYDDMGEIGWFPVSRVLVANDEIRLLAAVDGKPMTLGDIEAVIALIEPQVEARTRPVALMSMGHERVDNEIVPLQAIHIEMDKVYLSGDAPVEPAGQIPRIIERLRPGDIIEAAPGWQYGWELDGIVFVSDLPEQQRVQGLRVKRALTQAQSRDAMIRSGVLGLYHDDGECEFKAHDPSRGSAKFRVERVLIYRGDKHVRLSAAFQEDPATDHLVIEAKRLDRHGEVTIDSETIRFVQDDHLNAKSYAMRAQPRVVERAPRD